RGVGQGAERAAVAAGDGYRAHGRHRHAQQGDRLEPGHRRRDGQIAPARHLRKARRAWPRGADALRLRAWADRSPLYRKIDLIFHPTVLSRLTRTAYRGFLKLAWKF